MDGEGRGGGVKVLENDFFPLRALCLFLQDDGVMVTFLANKRRKENLKASVLSMCHCRT